MTALINAVEATASTSAPPVERHVWLVRLIEWLRHAPRTALPTGLATGLANNETSPAGESKTPWPVRRLRHLLNLLDKQPELQAHVQALLTAFWTDIDAASLFADFGFGNRQSLAGEIIQRIQRRCLPGTPETADLAALFALLFEPDDSDWVAAIDSATLARLAALVAPATPAWQATLLEAITILVSAVHASGYSPALRQRMDPALLLDEPFRQLNRAADSLRESLPQDKLGGAPEAALRDAAYLRAVLDSARRAAASVTEHLEQFGVSVNIVFELDQLQGRIGRIESLLDCVLAPDPVPEWQRLLVELLATLRQTQGLRALLRQHYSLLARQVAERNAESGEHYITSTRAEYRDMLRRAAGGGAVIAGTTLLKFALAALGLSAFWGGFFAGTNYAISFLIVMLLHWTVATKQPAMTAPAMAASLGEITKAQGAGGSADGQVQVEAFIDRVAQLIRSQVAGIAGNLALCAPLVLLAQWLARKLFGAPLIGPAEAEHVLHSITVLGPSPLFAAFTGVLLFASSLLAGWAENWFVFHRLDSAMAWNPRIVARLGAARARRWAAWWRLNVSGVASNVSLGFLLGLVPPVAAFFGLPLDVRHVTLSSGQLGAAAGALGFDLLTQPVFWWCVAGVLLTGVLNLTVSFWLAFKVALRSRGVQVKARHRIGAALRQRLLKHPLSFVWPPRQPL